MPVCQRCKAEKLLSDFPKKSKEFCSYCARRIREIRYRKSEKGKETQQKFVKSETRKNYEKAYRKTEKRKVYLEKYKIKMRKKYREDKEFRHSEIERRKKHFFENPDIRIQAHKRHAEKYPEKNKARNRLRMAVHRGTIIKPSNCEICDKEAKRIEAHHHDYSLPFDVIWMCVECHKIEHGKIIDDCPRISY